MKRRRKRRNQRAWFFTGMMFLFLVWIILFCGEDMEGNSERYTETGQDDGLVKGSTTKDYASKEDNKPAYLENLDDIEAGTVLADFKVDTRQAAKYFTVNEIDDDIRQYIDGRSYVEDRKSVV